MHCTFMLRVEGLVHTQRVSSQAKHTQVLRSSLRVAALGVFKTICFQGQKTSPTKWRWPQGLCILLLYLLLVTPVASEALDMTSHLVGHTHTLSLSLSPFGHMPGQTEWP